MQQQSLLFLLILALATTRMQCCCDTCTCWEKCFEDPPDFFKQEYAHLLQLVQSVRSARLSYNIHGTAYLMDSTVSSATEWNYMQSLARMLVLTEPAGKSCNPFFLSQYGTSSSYSMAWVVHAWNCQNTCTASDTVTGLSALTGWPQQPADWVWGASYLADLFMDPCNGWPYKQECAKDVSGRRMAVAIMNSNAAAPFMPSSNNFDVRLSVRVLPNGINSAPFPNPPGPTMDFETSYNGLNGVPANTLKAMSSLLSCMEERCCSSSNLYSSRKRRQESNDDLISVVQAVNGDDKPGEVSQVTQAELQAIIDKGGRQ